MWVIKLGGSVTHYDSLMQWLKLVVRWGDGKVIIVPGGGVYADAVREFQRLRATMPEGHIDDSQAHALAIYAMDQMARSLVAMMPALTLVRNPFEIAERGWQHRGLVWLPSEMALNQAFATEYPLPHSWDVTSDSLAAWLALQLDACQLLLVKSDERLLSLEQALTLPQLQEMGMIDTGVTSFLKLARFKTRVVHQSQYMLCEHGFDASHFEHCGVTSISTA
ncbi:hypothetical protein [Methylophilus sp. YYY-1]|uniref:amino acid kinase family protein n=1 Tax=Methylophilus sp. YYY-1 TaxID=2682087 RepID=UPI0023B254A9|nr:hypothetical protein [Methylophilus sp. YYY-1]MDF0376921.1 hypothetical protein [Methylophilus sp. YYY-1]